MSRASQVRHLLTGLRRLDRQQAALRLLVLTVPLLGLAVVAAAGAGWHASVVLVTAALAAASALLPGSHAPLGTVLVLVLAWLGGVPETWSVWLPVLGALLAAFHGCCCLLGDAPPGLRVGAVVLRRWAARVAGMAAAAGLTWGAGMAVLRLVDALSGPGDAAGPARWLVGAALLVTVAWLVLLGRWLSRDYAAVSWTGRSMSRPS
ncbi:MAG TPA: hypothetical protein VFG88_02340 [Nocardioidaceae bacterium]|nr:hypothetical protein [Nocardioidaceae bacterium]